MNPLDELKQHRNWIVHTADKTPWQISGLERASPTNPAHWVDYAAAAAVVAANPGILGLGFVLTQQAGYTVVDLDTYKAKDAATIAEHHAIHEGLPTYSEYSPSGKGVHIWLRGYVPSKRLDEKAFEVFADQKYCTVTFNPYRNIPIANLQTELTAFHKFYWPDGQNSSHSPVLETESFEVSTPQEVLTRCGESMNGDKFKRLWEGKPEIWDRKRFPHSEYPSHSEADLALCNILAFHSNSQNQVRKLWLTSPLAQTQEKKNRSPWVKEMVKKAFDRKLPVSKELTEAVSKQRQWTPIPYIAPKVEPIPEVEPEPLPKQTELWKSPTGLILNIASYVYESALYPTPEVAIVAAVTLMAAICGRAYNTVTKSGLNLYIALIGNSGMGKESAATGIANLINACRTTYSEVDQFIGPSDIASPQALLKYLGDVKHGSNSFYTHKAEIGFWLQRLNDSGKTRNHNDTALKQMLLDIYHKSGYGQILKGSIYSDSAKNAPTVYSPAFSILGDSTPSEFWCSVDELSMKNGFVSRFNIIECENVRPVYNPRGAFVEPDQMMIWNLQALARHCGQLGKSFDIANPSGVPRICMETEDAHQFQTKYQQESDDKVWIDNSSPLAAIYRRSHLKLLRLGALASIGDNWEKPVITLANYKWAKAFVEYGNQALISRFNKGEIGVESVGDQQRKEVVKIFRKFCTEPYNPDWWASYSVTPDMHKTYCISMRMIHNRVKGYACFRNSKNYNMDLQNCLDMLCATGNIIKVTSETDSRNGRLAMGYQVVNLGELD